MAVNVIRKICNLNTVCRNVLHAKTFSPVYITSRGEKNYLKAVYKDLYKRRIEQGPEALRHRSEYPNWNYESEVFAFGARLGEQFKTETLKTALTHQSFLDHQKRKRLAEGLSEAVATLEMPTNDRLVENGQALSSDYIKAFIRNQMEALPEEGVSAVHDYLTSTKLLAFIASNIGCQDIILCEDFPVEESTLRDTLFAVVGALAEDQGLSRAQRFVQDFIITQLSGKELEDMWEITEPCKLLEQTLRQRGEEAEPRLLWSAGVKTMVAAYQVGMYSDGKLIGKGYGETISIAEEMAARDCLRVLFGSEFNRRPLNFDFSHQDTLRLNEQNRSLKSLQS